MRYFEIARLYNEERQRFFSTATLYVLEGEWDCLQSLLKQHAPAEITAVRPLCRFSGLSVDVLCQSQDAASALLGRWHDHSVDKLRDTVEKEQAQREARHQGRGQSPSGEASR